MRTAPDPVGRDTAALVVRELRRRADPGKASQMATYMKSEMPFYGVQKPGREEIARRLKKRFSLQTQQDCESTGRLLWGLSHREENYLAVQVAQLYPQGGGTTIDVPL